jgi:hypothetical protein
MKFAISSALVALGLLTAAPAARATSFLEIVNKSGSSITTAANEVLGAGVAFDVGQLRLSLDIGRAAFVTFSFVGKESAWVNSFFGAGQRSGFENTPAAGANIFFSDSYSVSRLLDFAFQAERSGPLRSNADNANSLGANFGILLNQDRLSGTLLFDDGGMGPDRDYDDMVVNFRMTMQPVPEPTAALLMLGGLAVLGVVARRRRS